MSHHEKKTSPDDVFAANSPTPGKDDLFPFAVPGDEDVQGHRAAAIPGGEGGPTNVADHSNAIPTSDDEDVEGHAAHNAAIPGGEGGPDKQAHDM